jgi:hypothetical protein
MLRAEAEEACEGRGYALRYANTMGTFAVSWCAEAFSSLPLKRAYSRLSPTRER